MKHELSTLNDLKDFLDSLTTEALKQKFTVISLNDINGTHSVEITEQPFMHHIGDESIVGYKDELLREGYTEVQILREFEITEPVGTVIFFTK